MLKLGSGDGRVFANILLVLTIQAWNLLKNLRLPSLAGVLCFEFRIKSFNPRNNLKIVYIGDLFMLCPIDPRKHATWESDLPSSMLVSSRHPQTFEQLDA